MSQATAIKRTKPRQAELLTTKVLRRERLSPSFMRLTLAGEGLSHFEYQGHDQWFRLFLPRRGLQFMELPAGVRDSHWYSQYLVTPEVQRPWMRYVTVRNYRQAGPDGPEIDIDVVIHGEPHQPEAGPLSTWAQAAELGERVALLDQGVLFRPGPTDTGILLLGDETALPGMAGILQALPAGATGRAWIEVPDQADFQALNSPGGIEVRWLARQDAAAPGQAVLAAARSYLTPGGQACIYAAGEAGMISTLNETLRQELNWPGDRMTTVTYWRTEATRIMGRNTPS